MERDKLICLARKVFVAVFALMSVLTLCFPIMKVREGAFSYGENGFNLLSFSSSFALYSWAIKLLGVFSIIELLMAIGAVLLAGYNFLPNKKNKSGAVIGLTMGLGVLYCLIGIIFWIVLRVNFETGYSLAFIPLIIDVVLLIGYKVFNKQYMTEKEKANNIANADVDGYCSLGKHILLLLFTFGIWQFIWIYRATKFLNKAPKVEQYDPVSKLLLCMFVPFYQIYWLYKHGQRIDVFTKAKKVGSSDFATLCLILGIFIPIVAVILMQDKINTICLADEKAVEEDDAKKPSTANVVKSLKEFKELLDQGIITQEEFDEKKKSLLGM